MNVSTYPPLHNLRILNRLASYWFAGHLVSTKSKTKSVIDKHISKGITLVLYEIRHKGHELLTLVTF